MKKIIKYIAYFISIFGFSIVLGCFTAGNINVFEWNAPVRFIIGLISIWVTVGIILADNLY